VESSGSDSARDNQPPGTLDIVRVMKEMRAMRRLKPEPIPEELIREVIALATHAPSGVNAYNIRYVVVRDDGKKRAIASLYRAAWENYREMSDHVPEGQTAEMVERSNRAIAWQVEHLHEAPLLVFPCLAGGRTALAHPVFGRSVNGQVWTAVQNLMLACRAIGLGATITTLHLTHEAEVDRILGIPEDSASFAMIPIGYPIGRFGPTRGVPLERAIMWDGWS
jgi:nitroreductase